MKNRKLLSKGTKIRLKVRTMSGWKGIATVVEDNGGTIEFLQDGKELDKFGRSYCYACRHEISVIKGQL